MTRKKTWFSTLQEMTVAGFIALLAVGIFMLGGLWCLRSTAAPAPAPVAPQDATLKAIEGLGKKLDSRVDRLENELTQQRRQTAQWRNEDTRRYQLLDERLKRLEYGQPTPPVAPMFDPCDGCSEEVIPPHQ